MNKDQLAYLNVTTIVDDHLVTLELLVVCPVEGSETPLLGDDNLLPSGELVSCTTESLDDDGFVGVLASDRHDYLTTILLALFRCGEEELTYMLTRATAPYGLPQAPLIPCCSLIISTYSLWHKKILTDRHRHNSTSC
jgi:hypothetical protein